MTGHTFQSDLFPQGNLILPEYNNAQHSSTAALLHSAS